MIKKRVAGYRRAEDPARSCETCVMFLPAERRCTLVRGKIKRQDTCDFWEPRVVAKSSAVLPITDLPGLGHHHIRVIVVDADRQLLLLLRADRLVWEPVHGTIGDDDAPSPDETPFDAARRELEEETGYGGVSLEWRKLYERCWLVTLPPGAGAPTISAEHVAYRWFPAAAADAWIAREELYGRMRAAVVESAVRTPADYGPPPRRPLPEDEATAVHEAAHAVVGILWNVPVRKATIEPRGTERGRVELDAEGGDPLGDLVATLAGPAASQRIGARAGARSDRDIAGQLADSLARTGASDNLLNVARDAARELVNDPDTWAQIEAVADALLEKRTLSAAEVERIMAASLAAEPSK